VKNIKAGFRKASLVPFNPRKALERLSAASTSAEDLGSTAQEATKKIGRARVIFHMGAVLVEKESQELIEETKRIQEAVSRKCKKKVPNKGPQPVRAVLGS